MPSLEKEQLLDYLGTTYQSVVRRERVGPNRDQKERETLWESAFPGRSLGCFYLQAVHGLEPDAAAQCDVDGGADEGIDFVLYDEINHLLVLGQGKGGGDGGEDQPGLQDCLRFLDGVDKLLSGDLSDFGELSLDQKRALERACQDSRLRVTLVLAHFGGELNDDRTTRIENRKVAFDAKYAEPRMSFTNFSLNRAHAELLRIGSVESVNRRIALDSYAEHDGEYRCIYGRILASNLKSLHDDLTTRGALYSKNVRYFRGRNPVNLKVKETISDSPNLFFYLNNGITALCSHFDPTPQSNPGGKGEFDVVGLTIVNGAQTIGVLAEALDGGDETAYVFFKLIEVKEEDEGMANRISDSTNFQTIVENVDFLSTHARHEQIAKTLKKSGVTYEYRRSAEYGTNRRNRFTLNEAVETRVCAIGISDMLRRLKIAPTGIHAELREQIELCFPDSLSARTLWRQIQIQRLAQDSIDRARGDQQYSRGQTFFTHGVFVLKWLILAKTEGISLKEDLFLNESESQAVKLFADKIVTSAHDAAEKKFGAGGKPWNTVFRTLRDIQDARRIMMAAIKEIELEQE